MIYDPNSTNAVSNQDVLKSDPNDFLEQMPLYLLPKPFADMAEAIVLSARVPPSLAGCCVLGALSASIGSGLRVKSGPDRYSHSNLYILASASSGSGKSEAFRHALAPFFDAERDEIEFWRNDIFPKIWSEKQMLECEIEKLKREAKRKQSTFGKEDIRSAIEDSQRRLMELEIDATEPARSTEDATSEVLALLLQNSSESLASLSADSGAIMNNLFGRYNNSGRTDEAIYLKGWSGDSCKVNRIHRPPIVLNHPRVTALWLAQPDKIDSLLKEKSFIDGGLIPRLLVCNTNAKPTPIPQEECGISNEIRTGYSEALNTLLRAFHKATSSLTVKPSKEAVRRLTEHYNSIAMRMADGDLKDVDSFAARWTEQAWRISVCLHAGTHLSNAEMHEISEQTAIDAIMLTDWFAGNQLEILNELRTGKMEKRRNKLAELLKQNGGPISVRNLGLRNGLSVAEIERILKHYPAEFSRKRIDTGGRPSEIITLEPEN